MAIATAQNPDIKVLWSHTQDNISLRLLDIDYGYLTHGISALVIKLEIVNTVNDDVVNYYFEDGLKHFFTQYLQQYVNRRIRDRIEFESKGMFRWFQDLFKTKDEKDPKQFKNLDLMIEGSRIFGEKYTY
jgi:hypothetical protein